MCVCMYVCRVYRPPLPPGYRRPGLAAKSFLFPWKKKGQNKLLNLENTVLVFLFLFFEITETFGPNDCSVKRCGTSSWKYREKTIDTREVETVCTKLMSNLWMELWCLPGNLLLFETSTSAVRHKWLRSLSIHIYSPLPASGQSIQSPQKSTGPVFKPKDIGSKTIYTIHSLFLSI